MTKFSRKRATTFALFFLLTASPAVAAPMPRLQNEVPAEFADIAAVRTWANQTVWGGASIDVLTSGGAQVIVVQRSFTSGQMTTGLAVLVRAGGHWAPGIVFRTVVGYRFDIVQNGDQVLLRNSISGREVVRFSIRALGQDESLQASKSTPKK